ncbi:MAG: CoA-binding protein, partial [Haliea sp.]
MTEDFAESNRKVEALTAPRNVVLVGASDRPGSWPERVWQNVSRYDFKGNIYLINPRREELWGRRCYPNFASLPESPDHLAVLVPAPSVVSVLREAAAAGARSATVYGTGFGESHDAKGQELGQQLDAVIRETGIALSGPNCMGNVCGMSRLV